MHLQQFEQTIGSQKHATLTIIKDYKLKKTQQHPSAAPGIVILFNRRGRLMRSRSYYQSHNKSIQATYRQLFN